MRWLIYLLLPSLPLALAGCVTEQGQPLPMSLGSADGGQAACLRYGDAPTYGDCAKSGVSVPAAGQ